MNTKMSKLALAIGAMGMGMVMAGTAMAVSSDTSTLAVSATVWNNCAIGGGTLNFVTDGTPIEAIGNGNPGQINLVKGGGSSTTTNGVTTTAVDILGTTPAINIVCTFSTASNATITALTGGNDAGIVRNLSDGSGHLIPYILSTATNGGGTVLVNDGSTSLAYTGTGNNDTFLLYGKINGADYQTSPKGVYTETVTLSVNYTP